MKKTIYVFNDGEFKRKDNTLYFETETEKKYLPVEDIKEIIVFGEVNLNKRLLEFLTKKEVILHFLNNYGYYIGSFYPREHYNSGYMILKQSEFYLRTDLRLNLAKRFIHGAVANINNVIRYYHNRGKELETEINQITNLAGRIDNCSDIETLMAVEGNIREIYYTTFNTIIDKKDFVFSGRNKRPPQDRINSLISFGNTLAYITVLSEIYKTHLDPRIGFLHATNFRRFTLNLDVAEIFKPILVDRLIFSLLGRNMLNKNNFESKINGILMNDKGRKIFVEEWENRLKATIKHRHLGRNVSYRSIIRMELYKLEKHLMGEKEYQPFISRW